MKADKFWVNLGGINNTAWNIIVGGLDREHISLLTIVDEIPTTLPVYLTINTVDRDCKCYFEPISNVSDLFDGDDWFKHVTYDEFTEWVLYGTLPEMKNPSLPVDDTVLISSSNPIVPDHYKSSDRMDVIDVCKVLDLNFNRGNVLKYIARAGKKDDELQDLNKALEYLKREIKYIENKKNEK